MYLVENVRYWFTKDLGSLSMVMGVSKHRN